MKYKDNKNKRGFTLIELIAVLVIMAIIALIATPLVMNIVKKAKDSANKRSIDAYGKAVELAVATYLLDYGDYPTTLDNLTVEYTGNEVVCNIQTLNDDGSIYLSECSVKNNEVKDSSTEDGWYHYGKSAITVYQAYSIGDVITYNGMNFYVIEASDEASDRVTMLKAEPLTVDEVNKYGGVGTENNHVNMYTTTTTSYYQTAYDMNGYGGMSYYTSETCGYPNNSHVETGCTTDYEVSEVKHVVDAWASDKINISDLTEDNIGYKARLLTFEDLTNNLGYIREEGTYYMSLNTENTPSWVYNSQYYYWTMSAYDNSIYSVWYVSNHGSVYGGDDASGSRVHTASGDGDAVRPVVTLKKSSIR